MAEVAPPAAPELLAEHRAIEPSPSLISEAEGVGVAGALGDVAKGEEEYSNALADRASKIATVDNKMAADNAASNVWDAQQKKILDFQANNKGMAATDNLPQLYSDLENIRQQGGQGLSPMGQADYLQNTRRIQSMLLGTARGFAVGQRDEYIRQTHVNTVDRLASEAVTSGYGTPASDAALAQIEKENALQASPSLQGWSQDDVDDANRKVRGRVYSSMIQGAIVGQDFQGAKAIYDAHKGKMDFESVDRSLGMLKQGIVSDQVNSFDNQLRTGSGIPAPPTPFSLPTGGGNNRGNLTDSSGHIRTFASVEEGDAAMRNQLNIDFARGQTTPTSLINDPTHGWASEGAPGNSHASATNYASTIAKALGIGVNDQIDYHNPQVVGKLMDAMGRFEHGGASPSAGTSAAVAPFATPPPHFTPGDNPLEWKASYEAWGDKLANAYAADSPTMKAHYMASIRQFAMEQTEQATAQRSNAIGNLDTAVIADPSITTWQQLPHDQVQWLTGQEKMALQETINRARSGSGSFYTPEQQDAATAAYGQMLTDPMGFSKNPERWLQDPDLSFADRNRFAQMAARVGDKNSKEAQTAASWNHYLSISPTLHTTFGIMGADPTVSAEEAKVHQGQFAAGFMSMVENWQRTGGKPLTNENVGHFIVTLMMKTPGTNMRNYQAMALPGGAGYNYSGGVTAIPAPPPGAQ